MLVKSFVFFHLGRSGLSKTVKSLAELVLEPTSFWISGSDFLRLPHRNQCSHFIPKFTDRFGASHTSFVVKPVLATAEGRRGVGQSRCLAPGKGWDSLRHCTVQPIGGALTFPKAENF